MRSMKQQIKRRFMKIELSGSRLRNTIEGPYGWPGKIAELFGMRELSKWYVIAFWDGMGSLAIGAVGAAIVDVNYLIREVLLPESHSILSQGKLYHLFSYSFFDHQHPMHPIV